MAEVERFDIRTNTERHREEMVRDDLGGWVRYSDYEQAEKRGAEIAAKAVEAEWEKCAEDHVSKVEATKRLNEAIEAERARLAHGGEPDISPGGVIAAEPDGTITLDDGITTWNPARATAFLCDQAIQKERERLLNALRDEADKRASDHRPWNEHDQGFIAAYQYLAALQGDNDA